MWLLIDLFFTQNVSNVSIQTRFNKNFIMFDTLPESFLIQIAFFLHELILNRVNFADYVTINLVERDLVVSDFGHELFVLALGLEI